MAGGLAGKRVLVVEDEYFIASDMKRALHREEAVVVGPVGQLQPGLRLAATEAIDVAVLDVNLGDATTYELADDLTARNVPFMFVTGYDGWSLPERYRDVPRMAKPFSMPQVLAVVGELLSAAATG